MSAPRWNPHNRSARRSERGFVAGSDGLIFGVLIFVLGTLVVVNLWALIEARNVANSVARDYLRAYTEAPDPATAVQRGDRAAIAAAGAAHGDGWTWSIRGADPSSFGPCARASVTVEVKVAGIAVPVIRGLGERTVRVTRTELVDPYRGLTSGDAYQSEATPCG